LVSDSVVPIAEMIGAAPDGGGTGPDKWRSMNVP
jgi:hypothetical protein